MLYHIVFYPISYNFIFINSVFVFSLVGEIYSLFVEILNSACEKKPDEKRFLNGENYGKFYALLEELLTLEGELNSTNLNQIELMAKLKSIN